MTIIKKKDADFLHPFGTHLQPRLSGGRLVIIGLRTVSTSDHDSRTRYSYSPSSRYNANASVDGRSLMENRIASSLIAFSCECHVHDGTTKMSPCFQ